MANAMLDAKQEGQSYRRHQQAEQDRASPALVHHRQLASPQHSALIQISMSSSR